MNESKPQRAHSNKQGGGRKVDQAFDKAIQRMAKTPPVSNKEIKRLKKDG